VSEHECTDKAGRTWTYQGRHVKKKTWSTSTADGDALLVEGPEGWELLLSNGTCIPTLKNLIRPAIDIAQAHLSDHPPAPEPPPTTDQIRTAASGGSAISTVRFDAWLKQHDDELVEAVRSAASVLEVR
jgi:hypothetical protein